MARLKAGKSAELEAFWRAHLEGWRLSDLNQREYCELHGLPLKRFENWRAKFKHEDKEPPRKLLWRRGGGLKHVPEHMLKEAPSAPSGYIPSVRPVARRNFSEADKRRILEEAARPGASISGVARKYDIGARLLFAWKQELTPETPQRPAFLPVTLVEGEDRSVEPGSIVAQGPVIVERSTPGIEVELLGGRRVRFERDTDPETVCRLVALLEGEAR